ncbi:restriction endonuclease subunit S [[Clostridium] innocuum]|nr:restriction endonuclease subunit S [[Clostridium] innocuum]
MTKKSDAPAIRFKGFSDAWEQRKLSEIADKVTEKNAGLQYVETFTNSAEFGIISQRDFFDHDIAKLGSLDGYYIVKNEDFVYNPRISTSAPVGPINRNKLGRTGVMSPLYTVFRPHDVDTTYLEHFFKCAYWHSFMNFNGDSGARSDRFSIKDDVFFQMPIPLPYIDEQRKIGELLTRLDHLITLHQRQPFLHSTPEISLTVQLIHPFYTSSWEQRKLSEIADKVTEKNAGLQYVETFTNSAEFGIISQRDFFDHDIAKLGSLDGYYIVKNEDFVYNPRISTSAPVGPINRNKLGRTGVMSPLYTVFRPHDVDTTYLEHFFKCAYWHSFMNFNGDSGARSDRFSIKDDVFFQMPIPLPYIDEQRKIGELLTRLDHLITLHQRKGKAAVTGCSNDANNSKGVYCKARDFGYKCYKKVKSQQIRCLIAVFIFFV